VCDFFFTGCFAKPALICLLTLQVDVLVNCTGYSQRFPFLHGCSALEPSKSDAVAMGGQMEGGYYAKSDAVEE
jgi:hypothetical protein